MGSRVANVATICKFLRDRNDHARKTVDAMMSLPIAQRSDVLNSADYEAETKTKYTVKELAEAIPNLEAYQIRYALIGHRPHEIINKLQKEELYSKGIVIDYDTYGASTPAFEYDADVMYSHIKSKKRDVTDPNEEVKPEPSLPENEAPAESVTVAECNLKHLPRWLKTLAERAINTDDMTVDDSGFIIHKDGTPIVAIQYISTQMLEDEVPDDWTAVTFNPTDYASNEE